MHCIQYYIMYTVHFITIHIIHCLFTFTYYKVICCPLYYGHC